MNKWQKVKIGDLLQESKIESRNPCASKRIRVRLNVKGVEKRPEKNETKGATKQYIRKAEQFIYGKQNFHKGAFGIVPKELDGFETSSDIPAFDVSERCIPEWIYFFFKAGNRYLQLEKLASGVGSKRISPNKIYEINIPLPDTEEQRRIIKKIKSCELKEAVLFDQNNLQQSQLFLLRQQILQDAISGKLTADWRAENPDIEPASELLKKIKAEKEKLIAAKKIKKEKPLPPIAEVEIPFELPENWEWCRLGELCFKITDGFHNTPPKVKEGFPYIAATHVKSEKIDWENCHYVAEEFHRELWGKAFPKQGEVLVVNIGAGCGTPAIIDVDYEFSFKNTAILKFFQDKLSNEYLFNFFLGSRTSIYSELTKGGLQPFLSLKILNNIIFPLPPYTEQMVIIAKVEKLLEYVSQLEKKTNQVKKDVDMLMQAFLAQSFTG